MSEAEKKPMGQTEATEEGMRSGNVKPFPDFIVAPPGAPTGTAAGTTTGKPGADLGVGKDRSSAGGPTAAAAGPASPSPAPARTPPATPPRKSGGGGWAFLFALISLVAAGVSLSAPSLRPLVSTELKARFGDQRWIDILTGAADTRAPSVIQLDLQQFDKRLEALATTLTSANPGAPVDGQTLGRFADAAGATQRMAEFESALQGIKTQEDDQRGALSQSFARIDGSLTQLGQRTEGLEAATNHLGEQLKAANGQAEKLADMAQTADTATKELATALGGALQKVEAGETALADLGTRLTDLGTKLTVLEPMGARLGELEKSTSAGFDGLRKDLGVLTTTLGEISGQIKALDSAGALQDGRIDTLGQQADELTRTLGSTTTTVAALNERLVAAEKKLEKPSVAAASTLLGLANRLQNAINDGDPFVLEVNTVKALTADDPAFAGALATLGPLAQRGVPSLIVLRREFNNTARRVIEAEEAAQPPWYQRQLSTLNYYLGWAPATTETQTNGESARPVLSQAAAAINNGQFAEAVTALSSLHGPGSELALPWVAAARARVVAEEAVKTLARATLNRLNP